MTPSLHITVIQEREHSLITIFKLEGDIDAESYVLLQDKATEYYQTGTRRLLLDLSGVHFMGSAGLRALHQIDEMLRRETAGEDESNSGIVNGSFKSPYLKLLNPSASVARTLKLSGFDLIFDVFHDQQAAIDAF
ncbi:MAG: STAS domain-containing protein [Chloroflexota bacterium]